MADTEAQSAELKTEEDPTPADVNSQPTQHNGEEEPEQTDGEPKNVPNGHHEENEQPDTVDRNQNSDLAEMNHEHIDRTLTLPELVPPSRNSRFSRSMCSTKDEGFSSDIAKQEYISQNNQRSTVTPALSISAILNDVEFEDDIRKTPDITTSMDGIRKTPDITTSTDGSALSTYRSQKKGEVIDQSRSAYQNTKSTFSGNLNFPSRQQAKIPTAVTSPHRCRNRCAAVKEAKRDVTAVRSLAT